MPFRPSPYVTLLKLTGKLVSTFNQLTRRYIPDNYQYLHENIGNLLALYKEEGSHKSTFWKTWAPDDKRIEQINCITQLNDGFPEQFQDEAEKTQVHSTLLGALFYRYLRLEYAYSGYNGWFGSADENCALKITLKKFLKIKDSNVLDDLTIATGCAAYRDYLNTGENFARFSYIANNKDDFFKNLNKIIDEATVKSRPMSNQIKYLLFIESFPAVLAAYETLAQEAMDELSLLLLAMLGRHEIVDREAVFACISSIKNNPSMYNFLTNNVFPGDFMITVKDNDTLVMSYVEEDNEGNPEEKTGQFVKTMAERMAIHCQFSLLGAYMLVLNKCTAKNIHLTNALHSAMGIQLGNQLDKETKALALATLSTFYSYFPEMAINLEAWGGAAFFDAELKRQSTKINVEEVACVM